MQAVRISGAYKSYGKNVELNKVLINMDMNVERGSIYTLMGSSGCGKSTLLSCIIGSLKLDEGSVEVLGSFGSEIPRGNIGFMPQEYALVNEFTIRDVIYYFGSLYGMSGRKIKEQFKILSTLLELPKDSKLIKECSGGEKRRISFVVSMLHDPELLILDEPTVGLDSLLREKIWNYLTEQTKDRQLTVIITTHYIYEALKANRIGLMRNGQLIAEETPQDLIIRLNVDSLQDAFIKLSLQQNLTGYSNIYKNETIEYTFYKSTNLQPKETSTIKLKRIKALMFKNILQMFRLSNCFGIFCILVLPLFCFLLFHCCIGCNPIGLRIGIVNDEINYNECFNSSLITTIAVQNKTCEFNKLSCRFINQFNDSIANKVFYNNYQDALIDAKKGRLMGIIYFAANFTESFSERSLVKNMKFSGNFDNSVIQIALDESNLQWSLFLKRNIYLTCKEFTEKLFSDCGLPNRLATIPLTFQKPIYGLSDQMIQVSMEPSFLLAVVFLIASMHSSVAILVDRSSGIWNRTLIVGASLGELLASQFLVQSFVNISQLIIILVFNSFIFSSTNLNNVFAFLLILLTQYSGMIYGITISIITDNFILANYTMIGFAFPSIIFSGLLWPIQAMPKYLQFISKSLQFHLPSVALIDIIAKRHTLVNPTVLLGFGISLMWILILILISAKFMKQKKFSQIS